VKQGIFLVPLAVGGGRYHALPKSATLPK